jgi:hypothetical protein
MPIESRKPNREKPLSATLPRRSAVGCDALNVETLVRFQPGQPFSLPARPVAGRRSLKPSTSVRFARRQPRSGRLIGRLTPFQGVRTGSSPVRSTICSRRPEVRIPDSRSGDGGSIPPASTNAPIAQSAELRTFNPRVGCSIHPGGTIVPVVQRIGLDFPKVRIGVRLLAGTPSRPSSNGSGLPVSTGRMRVRLLPGAPPSKGSS